MGARVRKLASPGRAEKPGGKRRGHPDMGYRGRYRAAECPSHPIPTRSGERGVRNGGKFQPPTAENGAKTYPDMGYRGHYRAAECAPNPGGAWKMIPLKPNIRVEMVKTSHKLAIRGLKNPISTRIRLLETRLNPLKPMQVVDFPDIGAENRRSEGRKTCMLARGGGIGNLRRTTNFQHI